MARGRPCRTNWRDPEPGSGSIGQWRSDPKPMKLREKKGRSGQRKRDPVPRGHANESQEMAFSVAGKRMRVKGDIGGCKG